MFRKVMIANRGEVAVRVIGACRELGVKTVAIYSDDDRRSLHVGLADEAICVGPARLSESYLNIRAVIAAAEITTADAIHPGCGLLSEDANFAEACESCHIHFIGPPPHVLRLMGEKEKARQAMRRANVNVLPGSDGVITNVPAARLLIQEIGYPVMVKASGGAGGRGIRVARTATEIEESFYAAQSEARGAFGNGAVYLEKFIERTRHIEFQVMGDAYGNVMSLGERECSIQGRYKKLWQESPSLAPTEEIRRQVEKDVENCLSSMGYQNAGTVEFLLDEDGSLHFIEMNPQIPAEHAVTEMVTGLDLVKLQILLADGAKLQEVIPRIERGGHAIACRIDAENPKTFTSSPGKISRLNLPCGPGVRVDSAVCEEAVLSPYSDSLIATVVAHGADREEAIMRMRHALEMLIVEGIETTIPLHRRILEDPGFKAGNINTRYLEDLLRDPERPLPRETPACSAKGDAFGAA